ncbi:hypothetical protein [Rhizobium sp. Root482]|uniref:hypothetical protein n=1 Tax=Rhizobium sp. Root482 TaxID=1736543 RepID=UPI0006FFCC7A|nr:hypothetical protein [Rhizobium sp. Root482]KQY12741.1 hypothetical protein ASD31_16095 [Rhizobium sp. Root482]
MAARDRYSRKLECGNCGHAGFADVSEEEDPRRKTRGFQIDSLAPGFETEFASTNPRKHVIRCHCGHKFKFEQTTAYAPGGEPRY